MIISNLRFLIAVALFKSYFLFAGLMRWRILFYVDSRIVKLLFLVLFHLFVVVYFMYLISTFLVTLTGDRPG